MIRLTFKSVLPRVLLAVFVASFLLPIALTKKASAQSGGIEVIDGTRLIYDGKTYNDRDPYDTTYEWTYGPDNCQSKIAIGKASFENKNSNPTASIILQEKGATGDCFESAESKGDKLDSVLLNSASRRFTTAHRLDAENIFFPVGFQDPGCSLGYWVDDEPTTFRRAPAGDSSYRANLYFGIQSGDPPLDGFIRFTTSPGNTGRVSVDTSCVNTVTHDKQINYADISDRARVIYGIPAGAVPEAGVGNATPPADDQPSCEEGGGENTWILCPALRTASSFLSFVDEKLTNLLTIPNDYYNSPVIEVAWERMRDIAYLVLVPLMLVMVISTALGFDFISAYTIKKALPRLLIAAVFIALSLEITRFLIIMTNDVGQGVLGLVQSSFNGAENITLAKILNPGGVTSGLFTVGVVAGGVAAIGVIPVVLLYLVTAGLSLFIALLALAFRQVLLVAFMIIAPLAILGWIFPGNDKLWKLWWGSFSKLLLLFPLIMFLLGVGKGFAALVQDVGPDDFLGTILKLTAYIAPYFLIPSMFKSAGGIFAAATGMVNDRSRGAFDRLKKIRGDKLSKNLQDMKQGTRFKNNNALSKRYNAVTGGVGLGRKGNFGLGERGRQAATIRKGVQEQDTIKNNADLQHFAQTDDDGNAFLFGSGGTNEGAREAAAELERLWTQNEIDSGRHENDRDAKAEAHRRVTRAESAARAIGITSSNSAAAGVLLAQNKSRSVKGAGGRDFIANSARRLAGGNTQREEAILQGYAFHARGNGRADHGVFDRNDDGTINHANSLDESWGRQTVGAIVGGDTRAMEGFAEQINADWNSNDVSRIGTAAQRIAELQGGMPGATEANAAIINNLLNNTVGYDPDAEIGLEDQLADQINKRLPSLGLPAGGDGQVTGDQIVKSARKYSKDSTEAERLAYMNARLNNNP